MNPSKVTYIDSKVNNTEDYGTTVNIELGIKLNDDDSVRYILTATKEGCTIEKVSE